MLNALSTILLQQSVTTVPGASYTLSFALAGNPFQTPSNGPPIKVLNMSILDTSVPGFVTVIQSQQFKFDVSDSTVLSMNYKLKSQPVLALGKNTTIRFASDSQVGNGGPCLDSITFCQGTGELTPVPQAFALDDLPAEEARGGCFPGFLVLGGSRLCLPLWGALIKCIAGALLYDWCTCITQVKWPSNRLVYVERSAVNKD